MAKVLLIAPLTECYCGIEDYGAPALGVNRVAQFLRKHGHSVTIYDCNIQSLEWFEALLGEPWEIIGISILSDTLFLSLEMFIRLKERQPGALLVAGGHEATLNYQEVFDSTDVDVIVLAEGELPMLDLCNRKPMGEISGIIHRKCAVPITNRLLSEYYEDLDFAEMGWREYWRENEKIGDPNSKNKLVRVVTASHCNRGCTFCSVTRLREFSCGQRVTPAYLSGEDVGRLLERITSQLPETTHVYFIEDTFLPIASRVDGFCEALKSFKGRLKFLVQTDTDRVTEDIIKRLAEAGVIHISFGVENCSPRIRKLMRKPQNDEKIENIIGWCKDAEIRCYYLVILFAPESTVEDLWLNHRTLSRWQAEGNVGISVMPYMMPYRGTAVWYSAFEFAYKIETLSNGRVLKRPYLVYPRDPEARAIMERFREKAPEYLDKFNEREGHLHQSKDYTGKVYIDLLGDLLRGNSQETG